MSSGKIKRRGVWDRVQRTLGGSYWRSCLPSNRLLCWCMFRSRRILILVLFVSCLLFSRKIPMQILGRSLLKMMGGISRRKTRLPSEAVEVVL